MDSEDDMAYEDEYDNQEDDGDDSNPFPPNQSLNKARADENDHIDVDEDDLDDSQNTADANSLACPRICTPDSGDYDVLSTEQVCQYMNDFVKDISNILQLPATTTRLLLSHFNWDKECLMERFYEDEEKLFKDARVIRPTAGDRQGSSSKSECNICYQTLKGSEFKGADCGHRFCSVCWRSYLTSKIMDENVTDKIECPAHNCRILVDDGLVMEMVGTQAAVRRKYQHGITNSFVISHRIMRWCPGVDCLFAIRLRISPDWVCVTCSQCQLVCCFLCGDQWHDPATCLVLKRWKKKCADDSETSNWISANTKECPTCHATIEKDGGCNHVVCKNSACKSEFCWICLGPWQPHGSSWFKCNRYTEDDAKAARDNQEKSRYALQRYLFYFNRYMNHQQSLRLETKLNNSIRIKMEELQQHNMSWIEVQFLKKAVDVLQQCRQTLMFTYVFAFYLQKNNQQDIFEDNQHDLELATETLSGFLERDITGQNVAEIKTKVQDKAAYCELRRNALVKHVHEGYEKDWWEFSL